MKAITLSYYSPVYQILLRTFGHHTIEGILMVASISDYLEYTIQCNTMQAINYNITNRSFCIILGKTDLLGQRYQTSRMTPTKHSTINSFTKAQIAELRYSIFSVVLSQFTFLCSVYVWYDVLTILCKSAPHTSPPVFRHTSRKP